MLLQHILPIQNNWKIRNDHTARQTLLNGSSDGILVVCGKAPLQNAEVRGKFASVNNLTSSSRYISKS